MTYNQWILDFLSAIGAPATPQNIAFMNAWIAKESGPYPITYGYNPLNTTQSELGSYGGGSQGNIQFFPDYQSGLTANVATIQNGLYGDLLQALRGGNPSTSVPYAGLNTWGTGSLSSYGGSTPGGGGGLRLGPWSWLPPAQAGSQKTSGTSTNPNAPPWLQNISQIPILGKGAADIVSAGILGTAALLFFAIGGTWLIFGNESTRSIAVNVGKTATKAATAVA